MTAETTTTDEMFGKTNNLTIELMGSTVLVRRNKAKSMVGKIFMPDAAKERLDIGPIIATGPDSKFKVGAVVEWKGFAGTQGLETFDSNHLVIDEDDVLMIHHIDDDCWCGGKDGEHGTGLKA